jgi:pseudouridine synthase
LLLESFFQLGNWLVLLSSDFQQMGLVVRLTEARFHRPLCPGECLTLEVTLTQGKNLQIRKMFDAIGCPVLKLRRRRIGFLSDQDLPVGRYQKVRDRGGSDGIGTGPFC